MARLREPALRGAQLFAASGFALAQPLLDILGRNAEFFAVRGSTPGDIVLFALVVTFVPAAFLLALELLVGAVDRRAGLVLHLVLVAALAATFAIQALERLGLSATAALIALAALAGAAAAVAAWRLRFFRALLVALAPAPLVFLALFLFASPVRALVFPPEAEVALAGVRADTPVVVVVFDELPVVSLMDARGGIDARRYPNFAGLAADSIWFRNTTTLSPSTTTAVPAILTAKAPRRGELPVFAAHPHNLFTLLGGRYRLDVTETQTRLCPQELCGREAARARLSGLYDDARVVFLHLVAPPSLEDRLPPIDESWMDFGDDEGEELERATTRGRREGRPFYVGRIRDVRRFVDGIGPDAGDSRPTLAFLHTLLPHGPWLFFPDGRSSAVASPTAPGRRGDRWVDAELTVQAYGRHLLQLGFTDRVLGDVLARLRRAGLYRRALVVVTADHGISFRAGDHRRLVPTPTNLADLAFVPLFVKLPGDPRGRVVDRHVLTVDILPTIADALGVELPWSADGRSALVPAARREDEVRIAPVSAPFRRALAARDAALARKVRLFGTGDWARLFRAGRYGGLVGRRIAALRISARPAGAAVLDRTGSRLLRSLPRGAAAVPSPLAGALTGVARGTPLALALNGRVAAVTEAYDLGGGARFSALAPPSAFRPGANDVRVFALRGGPARPDLRELTTTLR